jgi:hypothetical protein
VSAPAQGPRLIQLPDTMGANFDIADTTRAVGTLSDYDFALGFWHFRFQSRRPDGTWWAPFPGHWRFERRPGGMLIVDSFRGDDPEASQSSGTFTVRSFHPQRKVWQMLGTNAAGAEFAIGMTWSDEKNRYAIQRYGTAIMRIRYFAIEPNRFLWRADRSTDGGKTWVRDWWTMEATRIGKE